MRPFSHMRTPVRIWPLFLETSWISTVQEGYASPSIRFKADANVLMSVILFVPIVFSILSVIVCASDSYGLTITHPTLFLYLHRAEKMAYIHSRRAYVSADCSLGGRSRRHCTSHPAGACPWENGTEYATLAFARQEASDCSPVLRRRHMHISIFRHGLSRVAVSCQFPLLIMKSGGTGTLHPEAML